MIEINNKASCHFFYHFRNIFFTFIIQKTLALLWRRYWNILLIFSRLYFMCVWGIIIRIRVPTEIQTPEKNTRSDMSQPLPYQEISQTNNLFWRLTWSGYRSPAFNKVTSLSPDTSLSLMLHFLFLHPLFPPLFLFFFCPLFGLPGLAHRCCPTPPVSKMWLYHL